MGASSSTPRTKDESRKLPEDLRVLLQFVESYALSWARRNGWMIQLDEAISIAYLAAGELVVMWDESKVPRDWRPIAAARVANRLVDEMRRVGGRYKFRELPVPLDDINDPPVVDDYGHVDAYFDSLRDSGSPRDLWLQVLLLRMDGRQINDIGAMHGVTGSRISQLLVRIGEDYRCWAEIEVCGIWRTCPRCYEVHQQTRTPAQRLKLERAKVLKVLREVRSSKCVSEGAT